jgi:hypothetical protein
MDESTINYALEPNTYLEQFKNERDHQKKQLALKKYFTERITKILYQNMDLLHATNADFEQFKRMYLMISKDLFVNVLFAVDTLVTENGISFTDNIDITESNLFSEPNEYSICESYLKNI